MAFEPFVLNWRLDTERIEGASLNHTGSYGDFDGGFFTPILEPPARVEKQDIRRRELDFAGLEVIDVLPLLEQMPDLFDFQPLVVHGRYQRPGSGALIIRVPLARLVAGGALIWIVRSATIS